MSRWLCVVRGSPCAHHSKNSRAFRCDVSHDLRLAPSLSASNRSDARVQPRVPSTPETRAVQSMTVTIDPATVAQRFREEIRAQLQSAREPLHLVGILAGDHAPSLTYALYAQRACSELGIGFELRRYPRLGAENAIRSANADAEVHGIIVYYPIFGTEQDVYLRELVDPGKD